MTEIAAKPRKCGLVMPISAVGTYTEAHWQEVSQVFKEALSDTEFAVELVSAANDVGVIQKRIVQNLYACDLVICDVSGKNPNVMFELGMRLAFDKPAIIVKDEETAYSFDTAPIEHLTYPRSLHYQSVLAFKALLREKALATFAASQQPGFTTFLKHFGEFIVANIEAKPVSKEDFILQELGELRREILEISQVNRFGAIFVDGNRRVTSKVTTIPGQQRSIDEWLWLNDYLKKNNIHPANIASFETDGFKDMVREYAKAIGASDAFLASSSWKDVERRLLGILNAIS